jgi:predicted RNA binding protein YcfA (HicA-like mRNA interferase family)
MKLFTDLLEQYKENKLKALSEMVTLKEEPTEEEFNKEVNVAKDQHEGKVKKKISAAAVQAVKEVDEDVEEEEEFTGYEIPVGDLTEEHLLEYEIVKDKNGNYRDDEGNVIKKLNPQQKKYHQRSMWGKPKESNPYFSTKKTNESVELDEKKLNKDEKEKKEDIVKGMKVKFKDFKARYGDKAKDVMYATATKLSKEDVNEDLDEEVEYLNEAKPLDRKKVARDLEKRGWVSRGGGSHDVYSHPQSTHQIQLPRHTIVSPGVARKVQKAIDSVGA